MNRLGWGLVIVGTVLQMAESAAKASATLNNVQFNTTTLGALVAPIEKITPLPLGWTLLISGAAVLVYCNYRG